ncbi:MAG: Lrp/AsnC family transcriptional regulator [Chloroflexi bacterium]|nr:MAG: Lrp/AsnC family transcriptional regulator [Chloroflexota bacterium]
MVTAIVLINVERAQVNRVAQALLALNGVTEVFSVAGQYDLVAILRTRTNEEIADLVTGHIQDVQGITRTETLMAFKVYSNYDLEHLFSIGVEA